MSPSNDGLRDPLFVFSEVFFCNKSIRDRVHLCTACLWPALKQIIGHFCLYPTDQNSVLSLDATGAQYVVVLYAQEENKTIW